MPRLRAPRNSCCSEALGGGVDPVGSLALQAFLVAGGSWYVEIPIPNNPRLNGLLLGWQAIFFGTDNPVGAVDTSPGLSMSIGT